MNPRLLPLAMMLLSLAACAAYAQGGDWRRAAYWLCAAGITASVTF